MKAFTIPFNSLLFLMFILVLPLSAQVESRGMDNQRMQEVLEEEVGKMEGRLGAWQFTSGDRLVLIVTDEMANRMRIFSPVLGEEELEQEHYKKMLEANFHSALDAKYSIYEGYVISVFTHPLRELTKEQLLDATRQVMVLAETFGTSYQSTDIIFSPKQKEGGETDKKVNEKPRKKS